MKIGEVMTANPAIVEVDASLDFIENLMKQGAFSHVPVMSNDRLVGVLSDRDLALVRAHSPENVNSLKAKDVMVEFPYHIAPDTGLEEVLKDMIGLRIGSAIVVDDTNIVGVFTLYDACKVLLKAIADIS